MGAWWAAVHGVALRTNAHRMSEPPTRRKVPKEPLKRQQQHISLQPSVARSPHENYNAERRIFNSCGSAFATHFFVEHLVDWLHGIGVDAVARLCLRPLPVQRQRIRCLARNKDSVLVPLVALRTWRKASERSRAARPTRFQRRRLRLGYKLVLAYASLNFVQEPRDLRVLYVP